MAFTDFTGTQNTKVWKIITTNALCKQEESIRIRGSETSVTITCTCNGHSNLYSSGKYNAGSPGTITTDGPCNYLLEINNGKLACTNAPGSSYGQPGVCPTGSWTAEDQGPVPESLT